MRAIVLYGKPECPLCDEAREVIENLAAQPDRYEPFTFDEIDIRLDQAMFALYRYRIPVVMLDGTIIAEGRMDGGSADDIAAALAQTGGD